MGSLKRLQSRGVTCSDLLTGRSPWVAGLGMSWEQQESTNPAPHMGAQTFLLEMNLNQAQHGHLGSASTYPYLPWQPELDQSRRKAWNAQIISKWFSMSFLCPHPWGKWLLYPGYHHRSPPAQKMAGDGTHYLLPGSLKFRKRLTPSNGRIFKKPRSPSSQTRETNWLKKKQFLSLPLSFQMILPLDPGRRFKCINRAIIFSINVLIIWKRGGEGNTYRKHHLWEARTEKVIKHSITTLEDSTVHPTRHRVPNKGGILEIVTLQCIIHSSKSSGNTLHFHKGLWSCLISLSCRTVGGCGHSLRTLYALWIETLQFKVTIQPPHHQPHIILEGLELKDRSVPKP